jgi:polar amino acid transport system substrate-binding protein
MKRFFNGLATLFLLGFFCAGVSPAADSPVPIAVDAAYPPYMFGTGSAKGLYPEIIRKAFSLSGVPVEVVGYPWKRALRLGQSGQAAVGGIYQNVKRQRIFVFSDPFYLETLVVCVKKGQRFPFRGIVDLEGKRVGINRGWSYGEAFDSARRKGLFHTEEATGNQANLKKLILGRLDCVVADEFSLLQILRQMDWMDEVETLDPPVAVNSVYLVVAKTCNLVPIIEQFNQGLVEMKTNGSYKGLVDRHLFEAEAKSAKDRP